VYKESNKIIVKVGDKSSLQIANSRVFRAITIKEMELLAEKHSDCHIVIVESIDKEEQDSIKNFLVSFKEKNEKNDILFFIPNNDEITSGIADELDYNIYLTDREIYAKIYEDFGFNTSIYLDDRRNITANNITQEDMSTFGGDFDFEKVVEETDIASEQAAKDNDMEQQISDESMAKYEETSDKDLDTESKSFSDIENNTEPKTDDTESVKSDNSDSDESLEEKIKDLKMQLRDANEEYNTILADMKKANARIRSLDDNVRVLKDEKQAIIDRYNEIVASDSEILEDPISLSDYSKLQESSKSYSDKISTLEATIESNNADISSKDALIEELKATEASIRAELDELKNNMQTESANAQSKVDEAQSKITEAQTKIDELQSNIDELNTNISKLTSERDTAASDAKELKTKLSTTEADLERVQFENDENKELVKQLNGKIDELEKSNLELTRNAELAENSSMEEKSNLNTQISKLEAQLTVAREQLNQKEKQYKDLVSTSGVDESGASALLETNKTLENISKTLREQLASATSELEIYKNKNIDAETKIKSLQTQVGVLQSNLSNLSAGKQINNSVPDIDYRKHTQIISVFGSGSFGITTTAISLAQRLSSISKVLYIDFDLVSPKADSWFSINPMIMGIPGLNNNDIRNSGLGIFYEYGFGVFSKNIDRIIKCSQKTKGGGLHYLSGIYYNLDRDKIIMADYASLFNSLADDFQYIIIDFGKFGCNDIYDSLIKAVSNISYKSIIVTTPNFFEIRNFRAKINYHNLYIDKAAWLLNMCQKSAIDPKVQNLIKPCLYDIMPKVEQYQQNESFTRNISTRDRFGMFVDRNVFAR